MGAAPGPGPDGVLRDRLRTYYTLYYRDTLGLPDWAGRVQTRLGEEGIEASRIPALEKIVGRPFRDLKILNVGCGTGGFNAAAERAGARTCGVDANPGAVEICALRREASAGGRYLAATAEALPFRAGSYDLVHCLSTLEHVDDVEQAIREMVRVTRPGGAILLYAPSMWALYENHYKLFWLPCFPRPLARLYLRMRGRPTEFLGTLNYLSSRRCWRLFQAAGTRVERFALASHHGAVTGWTGRLVHCFYWVFRIQPAIQLIARKTAASVP